MTQNTVNAAALTEEELATLDAFLQSDATPEHCLPIEAVDGFFCALIVGPQVVPQEAYLPIIWGDDTQPTFKDADEEAQITTLLRRHFNDVAQRIEVAVTQDKEAYLPIVDEWEETDEEDAPKDGEWWASGFLVGLEFCEKVWFADKEHEEMLEPLLIPIVELAGNDELDELSPKARTRRIAQLPALLLSLYRYWRSDADGKLQLANTLGAQLSNAPVRVENTPGRNDPCPCGSGKKYKKCCGA